MKCQDDLVTLEKVAARWSSGYVGVNERDDRLKPIARVPAEDVQQVPLLAIVERFKRAVMVGESREDLPQVRLRVNTRKVYASSLNRHVVGTKDNPSSLANLTVREVKVVGIERWLRGIGKASGPDAMKTARSVLSSRWL